MTQQEIRSAEADITKSEQKLQKLRADTIRTQTKKHVKISVGASVMTLIMGGLFYGFFSAGRQDNTFIEVFRYVGALFTATFTVTSGNKALNSIFELNEYRKMKRANQNVHNGKQR